MQNQDKMLTKCHPTCTRHIFQLKRIGNQGRQAAVVEQDDDQYLEYQQQIQDYQSSNSIPNETVTIFCRKAFESKTNQLSTCWQHKQYRYNHAVPLFVSQFEKLSRTKIKLYERKFVAKLKYAEQQDEKLQSGFIEKKFQKIWPMKFTQYCNVCNIDINIDNSKQYQLHLMSLTHRRNIKKSSVKQFQKQLINQYKKSQVQKSRRQEQRLQDLEERNRELQQRNIKANERRRRLQLRNKAKRQKQKLKKKRQRKIAVKQKQKGKKVSVPNKDQKSKKKKKIKRGTQ